MKNQKAKVEVIVIINAKTKKATAQLLLNNTPVSSYPVREVRVDGSFYLMQKKGPKPGTVYKYKKTKKYHLRSVA